MAGRLVDFSYLKKFTNNNSDMVKSMVELFLKNAPEDFVLVNSNLESGDWAKVHLHLHNLKSSFNFVANQELKNQLLVLEQASKKFRDGESAEIQPIEFSMQLKLLEMNFEALIEELKFEILQL